MVVCCRCCSRGGSIPRRRGEISRSVKYVLLCLHYSELQVYSDGLIRITFTRMYFSIDIKHIGSNSQCENVHLCSFFYLFSSETALLPNWAGP